MESEIAAQTIVSVSTRDSRIVYISATAYGTPQPNLTDTLTRIISDIGSRLDYWQLYGDKFRLQVLNELSKYGYKVENVEVAVSYRCPNCGAAIELNPEAIIYVCKYCGWSGDIFGKNLKIYAWPTLPRQSVEQLVKRFTGGAKIVEADLKYVPYWIFKASITVNYAAKVVYKVKRGKKYVRREANVGEKFEKEIVYPLIARLNAEFYGDMEMQGNVEYNFRKKPPKEVTSQEARNIAPYVLSPEISRDEAK
ncbi:MAG TPA: TFIIB-type zinc ribbon-containing protein, partial [Thermofilum sp.]|nr:TFIIB-type zinc ribbon-containing protein [Thermofilum sp.]